MDVMRLVERLNSKSAMRLNLSIEEFRQMDVGDVENHIGLDSERIPAPRDTMGGLSRWRHYRYEGAHEREARRDRLTDLEKRITRG